MFKQKRHLSFWSALLIAVPATAFYSGTAMATAYANETALQAALTAATPGSTVDITGSGTINITTTLTVPAGVTLTGTGTLQANASFTGTAETPASPTKTHYPMIYVTGSGDATISGITVTGQTGGNTNWVDGIYADNTGTVTITGVTVENIYPPTSLGGMQQDSGIIIVGATNAVVTDSKLTKIQKNYIDFASTGTLTATNNTLTGPSPNVGQVATNGIVVRNGTVNLNGNTITGMTNTGPSGSEHISTCIATIGGATSVNGGTLTDCDYGVDTVNSSIVTVYDNTEISHSNVQDTLDEDTNGAITLTPVEPEPAITATTQNANGTLTVTGTGVPNDHVTVTFPDGSTVTVSVGADGTFTATSAQPQPSNGTVNVTQSNTSNSGTSKAVRGNYAPKAAPQVANVPTTSEAGLAVLGILLAALAAVALRRNRMG